MFEKVVRDYVFCQFRTLNQGQLLCEQTVYHYATTTTTVATASTAITTIDMVLNRLAAGNDYSQLQFGPGANKEKLLEES